ncbi:MAG: SCO family protein [Deltaproteobacteria bacterium]|nr:SCO family protein [Deltaproteobacteria bacterium]
MTPMDTPPVRTPNEASGAGAMALLLLWILSTLTWWVLAFPPGIAVPPEWLSRVQSVCFGSDADGLPAPYGWGTLIAGPLGMLAVLLVGWGQELRRAFRRLGEFSLGRLLVGVLAVGLTLEAGWVVWRVGTLVAYRSAKQTFQQVEGPLPEHYPRLDKPAPAFTLVNQKGLEVSLEQLRGRVVYLTFAFGNCSTVCPLILRNVDTAAQHSAEIDPLIVVISLDAWRDRPSLLESLRVKWGLPESAVLLSGDIVEVNEVLDRYEVMRSRNDKTGDVDHASQVYVVDPQGRIAYALLNPPPAWLAEAGRRAARRP